MSSTRRQIAATLMLMLVYSSTLPAGPAPRILVDITFGGREMPQLLETTAVKEAALIWARYGVDLRTASPDCAGRDGAIAIKVVLADRAESSLPENALG